MRIFVLSDSHNSFNFAPFLEIAQKADMVIHCGDGTRDQEDLKNVLTCPFHYVKGNCDISGKREEIIDILNHRILVTHGDVYGVKYSDSGLILKAKEVSADIVLYGHTHVPDITYKENIWLINPGSLTRPRYDKVPTYCILEISGETIKPNLINF